MMNFGEWKADLRNHPAMLSIDLWLSRRTRNGYEILNHKGEIKTIKEGTPVDYNDYFVRFEGMEQLQAIADAFANYGVKNKNDHKNAGLLEAKDAHLQDMRTLTFKLIDQATTPVTTAAYEHPDTSTEVDKNANRGAAQSEGRDT